MCSALESQASELYCGRATCSVVLETTKCSAVLEPPKAYSAPAVTRRASAFPSPRSSTVTAAALAKGQQQTVGPDGILRMPRTSLASHSPSFAPRVASNAFGTRMAVARTPPPPPASRRQSPMIYEKRGAHAMGSATRSRSLCRSELGATAFGCPRWEPPYTPLHPKLLRMIDVLGASDPPSPLRKYRAPRADAVTTARWLTHQIGRRA